MAMMRVPQSAALWMVVLTVSLPACKGKLKGEIAVNVGAVESLSVRVVPEAKIASYLAQKKPQALAALADLNQQFEGASRRLDGAIRDYQGEFGRAAAGTATRDGVTIVADSSSERLGSYNYTYDPSQHDEAQAKALAAQALEEARQAHAAGAAQFTADKPALDESLSALRARKQLASDGVMAWETEVFSDLPAMGETALTAKNTFYAWVPRRGRVALIADCVFTLNGRLWHRSWAVWASLDGSAEKTIRLDENNMLLAEPRESLLH